jgi:hypothetical protein
MSDSPLPPRLVVICTLTTNPPTQMVESVLNMADYQTFSSMMRVRAAQMRKLRNAEAIAKKRHEEIQARAALLQSAATTPAQFVELFDSLRSRISELTPKRDDLRVRKSLHACGCVCVRLCAIASVPVHRARAGVSE